MKKRTALFAGTALLSLAAATALYAVNGDNCITAEGCFNVNAASCTKKKDVYAGNDVFGDGAVPAAEVDRIKFGAASAQVAIADVGQVIDGTAPLIPGTEESNLDAKARNVRGMIDNIDDVPGDHNIHEKLKNLAKELDGSNNLANENGLRLLDKAAAFDELIGTESQHVAGQVRVAIAQLDDQNNQVPSLQQAINNIKGPGGVPQASGVIGRGIQSIDDANSVVAKLAEVRNRIDGRTDNDRPVTISRALSNVQGATEPGGIIGNPLGEAGVDTSILGQLTAVRDLIDERVDGDGDPVVEDIEGAIDTVQAQLNIRLDAAGGDVVDPDTTPLRRQVEIALARLQTKWQAGFTLQDVSEDTFATLEDFIAALELK